MEESINVNISEVHHEEKNHVNNEEHNDVNNKEIPERLIHIKEQIELLEKQQQIQILEILNKSNITMNENKNGVFVNLTNLNIDTINELEVYIDHLNKQDQYLEQNEKIKNEYKNTLFAENGSQSTNSVLKSEFNKDAKDIKDTSTELINGEI